LSTNVVSDLSLNYASKGSADVSGTVTGTKDISLNVPKSLFNGVFNFGVSVDASNAQSSYDYGELIFETKSLNNSSKYWLGKPTAAVDASGWGYDLTTALLTTSGQIYGSSATQSLGDNFIKYIALKLFNNSAGDSLFGNTASFKTNLKNSIDAALSTELNNSKINEWTGPNDISPVPSGSDVNYAQKLFIALTIADPGILSDLSANSAVSTTKDTIAYTVLNMPLIAGDSISFVITLDAATGQVDLLGSNAGSKTIPSIAYKVTLNITN
jgi:hypothetical protein